MDGDAIGAMPPRPWWSSYVPDEVVEAFDACAATGVGPSDALARSAFATLVARLAALDGVERPDADGVDTNDMVGEPSLGLHLFLRERYGWVVPSGEALDAIAREQAGRKVVEVGCGSGYVAACLRARGVDVVAVSAPEGRCRWRHWWATSFVDDRVRALASRIAYDARAYVMLMPDGGDGGEDMMVEALTRMPVGSTLYLYAPEGAAGSRRGFDVLRSRFRADGALPVLDDMPGRRDEARPDERVRRYVKAA